MSVSRSHLLNVGAGEAEDGGCLWGSEPATSNESLTPALFWMSPFTLEIRPLGLTAGRVPLTGQQTWHLAGVQ